MTVDEAALAHAIPAAALVALDASATLAYLVGTETVSPAATWIFDGCLSTGRNAGLLSTLTAAELLVRPFRAGAAPVAAVEGFLRFFASIRVADVSYPIAREAGRVRAATGLAMPDAIVVGTALEHRAEVLVTNDRRWPASLGAAIGDLRIVQLADFVRERS